MTQPRLEFRTALLIGPLVFGLLYSFAGWEDFWKRSERRVAAVAREMIRSGDYLVPRLGGYPRFEKPPLMYWAVAESSRLFGGGRATEWTATLPSALAAMMVAAVATRFFILFTAVSTKQDHYLLPILPMCAMLTAWTASGWPWAELTTCVVVVTATVGLLAYGGVIAPKVNMERSARAFANEARRRLDSQPNGLVFNVFCDQSAAADLRAALFFYLGPDVRVVGVPGSHALATAVEFLQRIGDGRFVVASEKHWTPSWADEQSGLRILRAGRIDSGEFHLLTRTTP